MHAAELWHSTSPKARLARIALLPASAAYALGWEAYLAWYRLGFKKPEEPHRPVICVGNLQAGGSGKSPLTLHMADLLLGMSRQVAISCSGYGAPRSESATLAPDGPLDPAEWGDEPAMFRWLRPELPLVVGRARVQAAGIVHHTMPQAVMLMDDGFQHLPLQKHATILIDPSEPDNPWCLPAGPYREPRRNRKRADLVVPQAYRIDRQPLRLLTPDGEEAQPDRYSVLCAIGQPERFLADLERYRPAANSPVPRLLLPDHDPLDAGNLLDRVPKELPVVVTAKDWVKVRRRADALQRDWLIATNEVRLEPQASFRAWLEQKLNA